MGCREGPLPSPILCTMAQKKGSFTSAVATLSKSSSAREEGGPGGCLAAAGACQVSQLPWSELRREGSCSCPPLRGAIRTSTPPRPQAPWPPWRKQHKPPAGLWLKTEQTHGTSCFLPCSAAVHGGSTQRFPTTGLPPGCSGRGGAYYPPPR